MKTPLVSIGMSVYNCGPYIDAAMASLLCQTYTNWELLVVDDGSSDDTLARIRAYDDPRIRIFADGQQKGLPARLNEMIDAAQGTLFARMDGDDISYPERLEKQVDFLGKHPEVDVVCTSLLVFRSDGTIDGREKERGLTHEDVIRTPWSGFHFNHATWVGKTTWFRRFKYRPDATRTEDDDLMLRSHRHSRFARLPDILYGYRIDGLSLRKILMARYSFAKTLLREAVAQRDWRLPLGVLGQAAKAAIDLVAIGTKLNYFLLRHRAMPVAPEVEATWAAVQQQIAACEAERVSAAKAPAHTPRMPSRTA